MSYIQARIKCDNCQFEMNVAFGIVGSQQIAAWPNECPKCQHTKFTKIADTWEWNPTEGNVTISAAAPSLPPPTDAERGLDTIPCECCRWPMAYGVIRSNLICPCCGYEPEYDGKMSLGAEGYREDWIKRGMPWFYKRGQKPLIVSTAPSLPPEGQKELTQLQDDQKWRWRWHDRLGRGPTETEGRFYERIEQKVAALPPEGWQPMESAPKDGTKIDICAKAWLPPFDRFEYQRFPDCWWWKGDSMGGSSPQWIELPKEWSATHWMSRPPLPSGLAAPSSAPSPTKEEK